MMKRVVQIIVHDDYGFLDEVCGLFAVNHLARADFKAVELHDIVKTFIPVVMRQWNIELETYYSYNHEKYEDVIDRLIHRHSSIYDVVIE